jgi:hypothetical protein
MMTDFLTSAVLIVGVLMVFLCVLSIATNIIFFNYFKHKEKFYGNVLSRTPGNVEETDPTERTEQ